jgi:hypothetical protein
VLNSTLVLKVNLDVRAVATAVARALLSPTGVAPALGLTGLTTRDLLGRQLSEEEAQRVSLFWDENINAILSLYRTELEHLEAGSYKMPYDLMPSLRGPGSEQWDPLNVVAMARRYMSDQERVAARRKTPATGGVEVQQELSAEERSQYPEYYLQNFHFQSGGWLSKESAELYDYQVDFINQIIQHGRGIVEAKTGAGKTNVLIGGLKAGGLCFATLREHPDYRR